MESLSDMWESFSLSKAEGNQNQVHDSGYIGKHLLAAWFFTGRVHDLPLGSLT